MPNTRPLVVSITLFYFGVGDHRSFVLDFSLDTILGLEFIPMYRINIRRLISCQPQSVENYINRSKQLFKEYHIYRKID